jgi:hypothetical protein
MLKLKGYLFVDGHDPGWQQAAQTIGVALGLGEAEVLVAERVLK